jgi:protein-tyrosine phosphatase
MTIHPARSLPLQGASNFRDLGGYPGRDGRSVGWRQLFRSDLLAELTEADREQLSLLGLERVIDFRGHGERSAAPYTLGGVALHALAIEPMVGQRLAELTACGRRPDAALAAAVMKEMYRALVNDQALRFAEFFEHLLDARGPVAFHCTAGKDRTGLAAALVLLALGVPRETVLHDYLLTNTLFRPPPLPSDPALAAAAAVIWRVERDFLDEALRVIDQDHGGIDRYLARRLGLTPQARQQLVRRHLVDAPAAAG